ncbi:MAG: DUF4157 domain-containing protein [Myxococcales bacterium]|nr:DUF4157 domain-containing protein [Myxococcales bacterium]
MRDLRQLDDQEVREDARDGRAAPGKRTLTQGIVARRARPEAGAGDTRGLGALLERSAGRGAPVPEPLRGSFEESLGARLDGVRVHTDSEAAGAAESMGARAFATGQDIFMGAGQYDPGSAEGQHLLAHEVAHTVQQAGQPASDGAAGPVQQAPRVTGPADPSELEADRAADAMVAGRPAAVGSAPLAVARTEAPGAAGPAPTAAGPAVDGDTPGAAPAIANGEDEATEQGLKPLTVTVVFKENAGAMEYDAADYAELYKQVDARAHSGKCAGKCECGLDCNYTQLDKNKVTITVTITTTVPTWKQRDKAPPEHQKKFDAWAASVKVHEDAHAKIYKDGHAKLKDLLKQCADEAACDAAVDAQIEALEKDQAAFDADKSKQPAPLAIPGGVQKVP